MKKINTYFKKNPENLGRVINEVDPAFTWVTDSSICMPSQKFDGSASAIINGNLYKRFDLKKGRKLPKGLEAIPCQDPDEISGHHPHWVECKRDNPGDKWHFQAFDVLEEKVDGTYELCGEKVQKNPEKIAGHQLLKHGSVVLNITDFSYEGLKQFLTEHDIEGIIFTNNMTNDMCKLRKNDYGIKR